MLRPCMSRAKREYYERKHITISKNIIECNIFSYVPTNDRISFLGMTFA